VVARFKDAVVKRATHAYYHDDFIAGVLSMQPLAALDALCAGTQKALTQGLSILRNASLRKPVLATIPDDELIAWCDQEPVARYSALAPLIMIFAPGSGAPQWTSISQRFLERSPDPAAILHQFVDRFADDNGSVGSAATKAVERIALLDDFDARLANAAAEEKARLQGWIEDAQRRETATDHVRDERFE
jgi:hypothetical protein